MTQGKGMAYRSARRTVVADRAVREQIALWGVREAIRKTGLTQHTIERILSGLPVRLTTLQRVLTTMN
jgi:hypothetical protein